MMKESVFMLLTMICLSLATAHDQGAADVVAVGADAVEGEDQGVAELIDLGAEPERRVARQVGASDKLRGDGFAAGRVRSEGAGDSTVRTDEDAEGVQAERAQDVQGIGMAAAGGHDNLDAGGLGCAEGGEVARADAAIVAQQSAVHVQRNETWGAAAEGAGLRGWGQGASIRPGRGRALSHFVL